MKYVPRMPVPWDMVVFLTITIVGLGYSVHRLVAQIPLDKPARTLASPKKAMPNTADLGCVEAGMAPPQWESESGTLRFRGRFCELEGIVDSSVPDVQVRNLTNGFEGTVFVQGAEAGFVTDYVMLERGRNKIEIEWSDAQATHRVSATVIDL
ncbi:hypothetical protein K2X33_05000 [bacterium]|nr:hypothetical protein [bacterium]